MVIGLVKGLHRFRTLLFADDSLLFYEGTREECLRLKNVLDLYERASSQAVNYAKSAIFFSANISLGDREELKVILGVSFP